MPRFVLLLPLLSVVVPAAVGARQPAPIEPEPVLRDIKLDPAVALRDLRLAYTSEAIEHDLRITVKQPGAPARTTDARLRTTPGGDFVLRLGDLTVWAAGDELRATSVREPRTYFSTPIPAGAERLAAIERQFPPIPIPQLAVAISTDEALRDVTPYTRGIRWSAAKLHAAEQPARVILTGEGTGCAVTMILDAEHARLREFVGVMRDSQAEIRIVAAPPSSGAIAAEPLAVPSIDRRSRVGTLGELAPSMPEKDATPSTPPDTSRSAN